MFKVTLSLLMLLGIGISAYSQDDSTEKMVSVDGRLLRQQDSSAISGSIFYEKLPNFDDMGVINVGENGTFNQNFVSGSDYGFKVKKGGYVPFQASFAIDEGSELALYVKEDLADIIKLRNLVFSPNSPRIQPSSFSELDSIATWMNQNPPITIRLEGHTDYGGNEHAALELSEARVESVKLYLEKKGKVKKDRIFTKAYGGTHPLFVGEDKEKRRLNRRVEVKILTR